MIQNCRRNRQVVHACLLAMTWPQLFWLLDGVTVANVAIATNSSFSPDIVPFVACPFWCSLWNIRKTVSQRSCTLLMHVFFKNGQTLSVNHVISLFFWTVCMQNFVYLHHQFSVQCSSVHWASLDGAQVTQRFLAKNLRGNLILNDYKHTNLPS